MVHRISRIHRRTQCTDEYLANPGDPPRSYRPRERGSGSGRTKEHTATDRGADPDPNLLVGGQSSGHQQRGLRPL